MSIWESLIRFLAEADDDDLEYKAKKRLARAHAAMAAQGKDIGTGADQARRDRMARVMQDPHAARVMATPDDWEDELPGTAQVKGTSAVEPEELPKPDQPAPGTASGIGAGAIAAKNAEPTSVSLGARARRVDPGVSGIKQRFGVSPDAFYGDAPVKVDPKTGKQYQLRGRPKKDQPDNDDLELKTEPFAAKHAAAMAKNTSPKGPKAKPTAYSAGPFAASGDAHRPKGGEIRQGGKAANIGASKAGSSKLTATADTRQGAFLGQKFAPAGHTAPSEEEWAEAERLPPEQRTQALAALARRMGGKGGSRLSYAMQATGQRGRMGIPAKAGSGAGRTFNPYTGDWETDDEMQQSLQRPDIRAQIAAKLALRGADIANKRFGAEKAPWRGRADISQLGQPVDKSANAQKANARADAIASKPLPVNIRRDDETEPTQHKAEPQQQAPQAAGSPEGPMDRGKLKQMLAQRMAAMAAKKASEKK